MTVQHQFCQQYGCDPSNRQLLIGTSIFCNMRVSSNKGKALGRGRHLNKSEKLVNHSNEVRGDPFGELAANFVSAIAGM
jgi:hypothetical protein